MTPSLTIPNSQREDEATETELRHALFRLKTECEVEGLDLKPGFDAWVSWANKLLGDFRPAASARPSPGDPVRAALEFYASPSSYRLALQSGDRIPILDDNGDMARSALSVSTPTGEGEVREVLYFASYCGGENPACSDRRPCAKCLSMSNVFRAKIEGAVYARELGEPTLAHPQQGGERDGPLRVALKEITEAADELLITLPGHWHDDATIRLTDAASDAREALKSAEQDDLYEPTAPTSPSESSGEEA